MRELISLTKISLINGFNLHGLNVKNLKMKKELWKPLVFVLIFASLIPSYYLYLEMLKTVNVSFVLMNQEGYFIALAYNMICLMIFFFGLMYIMSYFYFSKETEMLLPLPLKPRNIVISKFLVILVYEYILTFLFLIPVFIINGINTEANILYHIMTIITLILTPIAPLSLSAIVMMIIMKFTNIKGKKDLARIVTMFLFLFVVLGVQIIIQRSVTNIVPGKEQEFVMNLISNNKVLINMLGYTNPFAKWLGISMLLEDIMSFIYYLLFILSNIVLFGLFVLAGEKIYLSGILGGNEVTSKKKELSEDEFEKNISKRSNAAIAIFKTDMTLLIKTPIYLLNCVSMIILLPFILIIMPIIGGNVGGLTDIVKFYEPNIQYFNYILAGAFLLFVALNPTASTTFSREGKYFWVTRTIPVEPKDQIIGRSLSPFVLQIALVIIMLIGLKFIVPLKLSTIFISTILGLAGTIPIILSGILVDIQRPLLNWTNPQRAVKQNLNVLISMVLGVGITLLLGLFTLLLLKLNISDIIIVSLDLIIITIASIVLFKTLTNHIRKRFAEIEN